MTTPNNAFPPIWTSAFNVPINTPTILVVDDDRTMRAVLLEVLQRKGYNVLTAEAGWQALKLMNENYDKIDAVILDREIPGFDGMEIIKRMKGDPILATIPVIMLTGTSAQDKIQEGIEAGVFYYLVKPADNDLLNSILNSALNERKQKQSLVAELNHHSAALRVLDSCKLSVRTLKEAEDSASLIATCFPRPEKVVVGLMELLVNAVEHGNLGISYEEKHKLLAENNWRGELDRLSALPENAEKIAEVIYQKKDGNHLVQITDAGEGFDWQRYWHINPARATASHGRGIARARLMAFDRMEYNKKGNRVTIMVSETSEKNNGGYSW